VESLCSALSVGFVRHDVHVEPGGISNPSAQRATQRDAEGAMTGHTMDDLVETVLLNMLRGSGVDGMSPMVDDPRSPFVTYRAAPCTILSRCRPSRPARRDE